MLAHSETVEPTACGLSRGTLLYQLQRAYQKFLGDMDRNSHSYFWSSDHRVDTDKPPMSVNHRPSRVAGPEPKARHDPLPSSHGSFSRRLTDPNHDPCGRGALDAPGVTHRHNHLSGPHSTGITEFGSRETRRLDTYCREVQVRLTGQDATVHLSAIGEGYSDRVASCDVGIRDNKTVSVPDATRSCTPVTNMDMDQAPSPRSMASAKPSLNKSAVVAILCACGPVSDGDGHLLQNTSANDLRVHRLSHGLGGKGAQEVIELPDRGAV